VDLNEVRQAKTFATQVSTVTRTLETELQLAPGLQRWTGNCSTPSGLPHCLLLLMLLLFFFFCVPWYVLELGVPSQNYCHWLETSQKKKTKRGKKDEKMTGRPKTMNVKIYDAGACI
jgi:hypothetical protein